MGNIAKGFINMLTSHERIMRIFQNKDIDRPAFKMWGSNIYNEGDWLLNPMYKPVAQLTSDITDLFGGCKSSFNVYYGKNADKAVEFVDKQTSEPTWVERCFTYHTPLGDLHSVYRYSTVGEPGMTTEYAVKDEDDLKKLLSIEYEPIPFQTNYDEAVRKMGDRGVVLFGLEHAAYSLQRMTGSENLAFLSFDSRDLVDQAISNYSDRILQHAKNALDSGIKAPFSWVGPELFIPPLMSPNDFDDFVFKYDQPLCDLIHNNGGYVWMHCHGKVANFLERFINMGIDVINPLEPAPNGDVVMSDIVAKYGNRIGFEGNIEIQEILQAEPEHLKTLIKSCVDAGSKSSRFILCPSAGFMEYLFPDQKYIDNLLLYLNYGYECVNSVPYK